MFMRAVHPGQVLKDELEELGITPTERAEDIAVADYVRLANTLADLGRH